MYSAKGDTILDPFLGTGTTTLVALALGRNSIGYEIDANLSETIFKNLDEDKINILNEMIKERLKSHIDFVEKRMIATETDFKYFNEYYKFPVITNQETSLLFNFLNKIESIDNQIVVNYSTIPELNFGYVKVQKEKKGQQVLAF
jgi:modification methylase